MKRTIRRYKLGYVLGATLCFIGLTALSVVMWRAWPEISLNADPVSAFWTFLWAEQLSLFPGVEFKFVYLIILAVATLSSAVIVFAFSRQWFSLPTLSMKLQCPFCKKYWRVSYNAGQVLCPHCRHLVHPKRVEE